MTGIKLKAAIIGSGNIGSDLMIKILRNAKHIEIIFLVGIDSESDGLKRAERLGVTSIATGIDGLIVHPRFLEIDYIFDATSASAHLINAEKINKANPNVQIIDLTPAAIGPYCVPVVNGSDYLNERNVNMVTCGGQATIPIVSAVSSITEVYYAEIIASIASKSAGPGTRANIDEFTETTSKALQVVGGAKKGKAIIILNPAEPPLIMRDTVFILSKNVEQERIKMSIKNMVEQVAEYVPGYRLKQDIQFEIIDELNPVHIPGYGNFSGLKTSVFLEVEGAAHYLPEYAGNLDIMTSAALATAEKMAEYKLSKELDHVRY